MCKRISRKTTKQEYINKHIVPLDAAPQRRNMTSQLENSTRGSTSVKTGFTVNNANTEAAVTR